MYADIGLADICLCFVILSFSLCPLLYYALGMKNTRTGLYLFHSSWRAEFWVLISYSLGSKFKIKCFAFSISCLNFFLKYIIFIYNYIHGKWTHTPSSLLVILTLDLLGGWVLPVTRIPLYAKGLLVSCLIFVLLWYRDQVFFLKIL